jgi:AcrR family transcriptional regulator
MSTKRLLQAAVDSIAERGYERSTLVEIGERAGYSRGMVTGRFGSKENLLWHLLERHFVQWSEDTLNPDLDKLPAPQALEHVLDRTRQNVRDVPTHMRALYSILFESLVLVPEVRNRVADIHRRHRERVQEIIQRGIDEGSIVSTVVPDALAAVWVGAFRGIAFQWLLDPEEFDLDAALICMAQSMTALVSKPTTPKGNRGRAGAHRPRP